MTTIATTIKPTSIIMTRRTPTQSRRQEPKKKKRIIKTGTVMIGMKIGTLVIGTKIVSVNQVPITINANLVVRIKQNAISDTVLNIQSLWRHCLQNTIPIIFSL